MNTDTTASRQWATRPADERFTSLTDLHQFTSHQRSISAEGIVTNRQIEAVCDENDLHNGLRLRNSKGNEFEFTNWAFNQACQRAGAPAGYLGDLPASLTADLLNYGWHHARNVEEMGALIRVNGSNEIAALTGPNYGRVWNSEVTGKLVDLFGDGLTGDWRIPGEFGQRVPVTKQNTTLYASDRDMFAFLADEDRKIDIPDRRHGQPGSMARGFYVWNSEVGSTSLGGGFFLMDYVCMNRIIWGQEQFNEIRLRHTKGAPDRWLEELVPVLTEFANSAPTDIVTTIEAAKQHKVAKATEWLAKRHTAKLAQKVEHAFEKAEGKPMETLWDITTGLTELAKNYTHQDARIALERDAGKILQMAA